MGERFREDWEEGVVGCRVEVGRDMEGKVGRIAVSLRAFFVSSKPHQLSLEGGCAEGGGPDGLISSPSFPFPGGAQCCP